MMSASVFEDRSKEPTLSELYEVLGETAAYLKDIEQYLQDQLGELTHEWKFYSKQAGWTLALAHEGRRVFHLIPHAGLFTVVFTLGQRAVTAAQESDLPQDVLSAIENARQYAEGRSVRFDVTTSEDVAVVKQIIVIKMSN